MQRHNSLKHTGATKYPNTKGEAEVGIDVHGLWTKARTMKWNERDTVIPLLTQGCSLQTLYLSVLSIRRLVNVICAAVEIKTSRSHLPADF